MATSKRSKSPAKKSPSKKSPAKKSTPKKAAPAKKASPSASSSEGGATVDWLLISLRLAYLQAFFFGVALMVAPVKLCAEWGVTIETGSIAELAMVRFGIAVFGLGCVVAAAAQGTAATQKKCLQYLMVYWSMIGYSFCFHTDHTAKGYEGMNYFSVAEALFNILISVYACYCPVAKK